MADDPRTRRPRVFDDDDVKFETPPRDHPMLAALSAISFQLDRMIVLLEDLVYEEGPPDDDGEPVDAPVDEPAWVRDEWNQFQPPPEPRVPPTVIHFPRRDRPA